jgi:hypothetical protein
MLGEIEWLYSRIVDRCPAMPTSDLGHSRRFRAAAEESGLPPIADITSAAFGAPARWPRQRPIIVIQMHPNVRRDLPLSR